jgi:hypothetical protein
MSMVSMQAAVAVRMQEKMLAQAAAAAGRPPTLRPWRGAQMRVSMAAVTLT